MESDQRPGTQQEKDPWADIRARLDDLGPEQNDGRWAAIKDRLAIAAVILILLLLIFLMIDGWVVNFRCSLVEHITFVCNRWAGGEAP